MFLSGTLTNPSNEKLKEEIAPLKNSLEKLSGIKGVSFMMKDRKLSDIREFGVLAQDVLKVYPELVNTFVHDDGEEYYAVNYIGLIAPLIEATNELRELNKTQSEKIKVLTEENKIIKEALCSLQNEFAFCKN